MDSLVIQATAPIFKGNFEAVKAQLIESVKQYDVAVTHDNLADAKKMATSLNKLSKMVDEVRKEKVAEVSAPIDIFKGQIKELIGIIQDSRTKIVSQVEIFEDETKAECLKLLEAYRDETYDAMEILDKYRTVDVSKLAILTSLTPAGNLTGKAMDAIDSMIAFAKLIQDRTKIRVLELPGKSKQAGLLSTLTEEQISGFIDQDDKEYASSLEHLLSSMLSMQNAIEEKVEKKVQQEVVVEPEPEPIIDGKREVIIEALFKTTVSAGVANERIVENLQKAIEAAGFKTCYSVRVIK